MPGVVDGVDVVAAVQHIAAVAALEPVVAVLALEQVVAVAAEELIVAVASPELAAAAGAGEAVVARAAEDDLVVGLDVVALAGGAVVRGSVGDGHAQRRGDRRVVDVVAAVAARDEVGAVPAHRERSVLVLASEEPVAVGAAVHGVGAGHPGEPVEPDPSAEIVVAVGAVELIVAGQSLEQIPAGSAVEHVRRAAARELVGGLPAHEVLDRGLHVVALAPVAVVGHPVDRDEHRWGAAGVGDRVGAAVAVHVVGPAATVHHVVALRLSSMGASVAEDQVGAAAPLEDVGPGAARYPRRHRRARVNEIVVVVHLEGELGPRTAGGALGRAGDLDRGDRVAHVRERGDQRSADLGVEELAARELLGDEVALAVGEAGVDEVDRVVGASVVEKGRRGRRGAQSQHQPRDRDGRRKAPPLHPAACCGLWGGGSARSAVGFHAGISLIGATHATAPPWGDLRRTTESGARRG